MRMKNIFPRILLCSVQSASTLILAGLLVSTMSLKTEAETVKPSPAAASKPAVQSPPQGEPETKRIETTSYDSWIVTCEGSSAAANTRHCSASFKVIDQKSGSILLIWSITEDKSGAFLNEIYTMTGIMVDRGVDIALGTQTITKKAGFIWCETNQCMAQLTVDEGYVRDLSAARDQQAALTIVSRDGRSIQFKLPLKGIDRALGAMKR